MGSVSGNPVTGVGSGRGVLWGAPRQGPPGSVDELLLPWEQSSGEMRAGVVEGGVLRERLSGWLSRTTLGEGGGTPCPLGSAPVGALSPVSAPVGALPVDDGCLYLSEIVLCPC